jgi:gliding motility-associated-like protein
MQKLKNYAFLLFVLLGIKSFGQVFWTENFSNACPNNCPATSYSGTNGAWSSFTDGFNDTDANVWMISYAENGAGVGSCSSTGGTNPTLHITSDPASGIGSIVCPNDCGAQYLSFPGSITDRRIESPVINCTGQTTITLKFTYILGGVPGTDFLTVWYFDGTTWSTLGTPAQTTVCGGSDGIYAVYTVALPASANNNANVRLGFQWVNDDSGSGVDPSVAIDDITLSATSAAVPPTINVTGPTTLCIGQVGTYTATATAGAPINTWTWGVLPPGTGSATGQANGTSTCTVNYSFATAGTYTIGCAADNGTPPQGTGSVVVTVSANLVPAVSIAPAGPCAAQSTTITATPTNGGSAPTYQWFVNGTPQAGSSATFVTSTLAVGDLVTCTMTSNSACASPTTANSNTLTAVNCSANPTPSITSATLNGCVNQPISLSGSASPSSGAVTNWAWTSNPATGSFTAPAAQNTSFTPTAAGSYTITLTVQPGGGTATTTLTIAALPTVNVTPNADTVCIGGTGTTLTASGTATTYTWSPAAGLSSTTGTVVTANPSSNTTYTVTGTANGCSNTASSQITALVVSPVVATAASNYVCTGSTTSITTSAPAALSYSWTPATGLSCTNCGNPIVSTTGVDTTIYTVTVTGQCFSNTSDTVIIYAVTCGPPIAGFTMSDSIICRYSCIQYTDTSKYEPLQYLWVFEGGIPDTSYDQNPRVCYNIESSNWQNGWYHSTLIVTNLLGEKDTIVDSVQVKISPVANINNNQTYTTIELGTSTTLNAGYSSGTLYYSWTAIPSESIECPTCSAIEVNPQQNTYYIVKASNGFGCFDYDTILVKVEKICGEVFIPTAFSPNGDKINDNALVKNNDCIRSIVFSIFDRWGEKVFYTEDPAVAAKGWDGNYKGQPMDAGVFVYYVDIVLSDNTVFSQKGNITLVR